MEQEQEQEQEQETSCSICAESYSKRMRACIKCPYCPIKACIQCYQTYFLSESTPHCFSTECNREWSRKILTNTFSAVFLNKKLKNHREQIMFEQERALLPETQPIVENIIRIENNKKQILVINRQIQELYRQRDEIQRTMYDNPIENTERRTFIRACPSENCRGFLSSQWKCGLCEQWTCPTCNEIKGANRDDPHECLPENVATATLLRQDTRPCPSCGIGIFRISGCDQMWCTECHTGFHWITGRIETREFHNPHFYEWLQRNNQNIDEPVVDNVPNDRACEQNINTRFVRHLDRNLKEKRIQYMDLEHVSIEDIATQKAQCENVVEICRALIHFREYNLNQYQVDHVLNNRDLRVQYMRNQISEDKFKQLLQRKDKKNQRYRDTYQVLQVVYQACTDILFRFSKEINKEGWIDDFGIANEITALTSYANECFLDIGKTYNSLPLHITNQIRLVRGYGMM